MLVQRASWMDESLKAEKFIVQGCAARMFLVPEYKEGLLFFHMDTEGERKVL